METKARYALVGAFTLASILAGFLFVYWLNAAGSIGDRKPYRILYDGPVAGLLKGSAVHFNGLRVGEVTRLELDERKPQQVMVTIAVTPSTPVRADTTAGIDFQGLAGAPVVALTGGTGASPVAKPADGQPPLLTAEKNAGAGMSQAARDVLRHIDAVVKDNAEPLRSLIGNVDKFAGALARNSDRIDGIVAGLERMTGGGAKPAVRIIDLPTAIAFPGLVRIPSTDLLVSEPSALGILDGDKVFVRSVSRDKASLDGAQWPDVLPKLVQTRLVQSFENAKYQRVLSRLPDGGRTEHQLMTEIRRFDVSADTDMGVSIEIAAKIVGAEARIVDVRVFRATVPLGTLDTAATATALGEAFQRVAAEIVVWTCGAL